MKVNIDHLSSTTGWILNAPSTIKTISDKNAIAGLNEKSLMITFDSEDSEKKAYKVLSSPVDVTEYETLIFSVYSYHKNQDIQYSKPEDFLYKITFDGVTEFYFPVFSVFTDIEIGIEDVSVINQITITGLFDDSDSLIISEMVAEKEEIEIDILSEAKENIDFFINKIYGDGILISSGVACGSGSLSITLNNPEYLERYAVIKIKEGINSEIHQIIDNDGLTFKFNDNFDGRSIQKNYSNASVYLYFPTQINPGQNEVFLPGVSIWGMSPEPVLRGSKLDLQEDTFYVSGGSKQRIEGQILKFTILVTVEARTSELIHYIAKAVRQFVSGESIWINGRRHDIYYSGPATELPPSPGGIDYMPQVQYSFNVEVKENINNRSIVPKTDIININTEPRT